MIRTHSTSILPYVLFYCLIQFYNRCVSGQAQMGQVPILVSRKYISIYIKMLHLELWIYKKYPLKMHLRSENLALYFVIYMVLTVKTVEFAVLCLMSSACFLASRCVTDSCLIRRNVPKKLLIFRPSSLSSHVQCKKYLPPPLAYELTLYECN